MSFSGDQDFQLKSMTANESSFGDESSLCDSQDSLSMDDDNSLQSRFTRRDEIDLFATERFELESQNSLYTRTRNYIRRRLQQKRTGVIFPSSLFGTKRRSGRIFCKRPRFSKCVVYVLMGYIFILGIIHFFDDVLEVLEARFPDDMDWILSHWGLAGEPTEGFGRWPTDATADVHPVNCHSHNDYWRSIPLYEAVYAGCTGAEADVWLVEEELYVGHRKIALTENRTLRNLYISPLLEIVGKQNPPAGINSDKTYPPSSPVKNSLNGVFDVDPAQTFILLIDFKSSGPSIWPRLVSQLEPLREKGYLTHFNGTRIVERPITVVATGDAPFDLITANETYRDVFFDAPLHEMADLSSQWPNPNRAQDPTRGNEQSWPGPPNKDIFDDRLLAPLMTRGSSKRVDPGLIDRNNYGPFNSYYASTSFTSSIGRVWGSRLTQEQLQLIRGQIKGAHERGLKVRYWSLPQWPIGLRNHVWHILMREGVDVLNVDDLRHATRRDWRKNKGWWY